MERKELQNIYNIQDLLKGCIYRMCITDNEKELDKIYEDAKGYLQLIYIIAESKFDNLIKGELNRKWNTLK